jgi:hypothetical protein
LPTLPILLGSQHSGGVVQRGIQCLQRPAVFTIGLFEFVDDVEVFSCCRVIPHLLGLESLPAAVGLLLLEDGERLSFSRLCGDP